MRIDEGFQEETNDVETYLTLKADLVPGQLAKIAASHLISQGLHLRLVTSISHLDWDRRCWQAIYAQNSLSAMGMFRRLHFVGCLPEMKSPYRIHLMDRQ